MLTSLYFIAAAEGLSFFFFKIFNTLDWLSWESVTEFNIIFSPKHIKKAATQITPTATQFNFWVAETAMQNFDSKFIPDTMRMISHCTVLCAWYHTVPYYAHDITLYRTVRMISHCTVLCVWYHTVPYCAHDITLYRTVRMISHCTVLCAWYHTVPYCAHDITLYRTMLRISRKRVSCAGTAISQIISGAQWVHAQCKEYAGLQ